MHELTQNERLLTVRVYKSLILVKIDYYISRIKA